MKPGKKQPPGNPKARCGFCGSTVGQVDYRTGRRVKALYNCPGCTCDYCDQCSEGGIVDGDRSQFCLRCGGRLEKVM